MQFILLLFYNRIKSLFGRPYWEKDIMKELGLYNLKVI